jgi:hypothetical protein
MHRIDKKGAMTVNGVVTCDLSMTSRHPIHERALGLGQGPEPAILRLFDPVAETIQQWPSAGFVSWVSERPSWAREVFAQLQAAAETFAGEPLLTTSLSADRFWALLRDVQGDPTIDALAERTRTWQRLGLDEIFFDFHVVGWSADESTRVISEIAAGLSCGTV